MREFKRFNDAEAKRESHDDSNKFDSQSKNIINNVLNAFKSEENYTKGFRYVFSIIIILFMLVNFVAILLVCKYAVLEKEPNIASVATVLVALIAEMVGLLAIIFKYLFNRKENKILEIMLEYLKVKSKHDLNNLYTLPYPDIDDDFINED
jgi:hypothetical protein